VKQGSTLTVRRVHKEYGFMTVSKTFQLCCLLSAIFSAGYGCTTPPNVTEIIEESPKGKPKIVSSKGALSPKESEAVLERLRRSVGQTDLLKRHTAIVESVTESPLTRGNKVTLLADGPATYAAMFRAIQHAKHHVNMESYIIEDDDTGRKFADLLLKKQASGVRVHIIYDSMGSINTPDTFFQRLRDGGIEVVGFNPLNPAKPGKNWSPTHRDHRKILIADGKIAIIGGVNISQVYSSSPGKRKKRPAAPIHWRDTDIQIEGPAVAELQKLFLDTWLKQKGGRLPGRNLFPDLKETGGVWWKERVTASGQINN